MYFVVSHLLLVVLELLVGLVALLRSGRLTAVLLCRALVSTGLLLCRASLSCACRASHESSRRKASACFSERQTEPYLELTQRRRTLRTLRDGFAHRPSSGLRPSDARRSRPRAPAPSVSGRPGKPRESAPRLPPGPLGPPRGPPLGPRSAGAKKTQSRSALGPEASRLPIPRGPSGSSRPTRTPAGSRCRRRRRRAGGSSPGRPWRLRLGPWCFVLVCILLLHSDSFGDSQVNSSVNSWHPGAQAAWLLAGRAPSSLPGEREYMTSTRSSALLRTSCSSNGRRQMTFSQRRPGEALANNPPPPTASRQPRVALGAVRKPMTVDTSMNAAHSSESDSQTGWLSLLRPHPPRSISLQLSPALSLC